MVQTPWGPRASWPRTPSSPACTARLDPITDRLAEDPDSADALDRMRELGVGTVDPSPAACEREGAARRRLRRTT